MRNKQCMTCNIARNTEKSNKWEMSTVGPGLWQGNGKGLKWDTHTVGPIMWWENWQTRRRRNSHCSIWNMARNTEKHAKWETNTVRHRIWRETVKNMKNEKCPR